MRNIREALNSALIVGGLMAMGGGSVDAVQTVLSPEVRVIPAITQELRNDFKVQEECVGLGPAGMVCQDVADKMLAPDEAAQQITSFRKELEQRTESINQMMNRRLPIDVALMVGGGVAVHLAQRKKK